MAILMRFQQELWHLNIHAPQLLRERLFGRAVFALAMLALSELALAMPFARLFPRMFPSSSQDGLCFINRMTLQLPIHVESEQMRRLVPRVMRFESWMHLTPAISLNQTQAYG